MTVIWAYLCQSALWASSQWWAGNSASAGLWQRSKCHRPKTLRPFASRCSARTCTGPTQQTAARSSCGCKAGSDGDDHWFEWSPWDTRWSDGWAGGWWWKWQQLNEWGSKEANHWGGGVLNAAWDVSPVRILLCMVTAEAQVEVFTHIAVYPAAHNEPLAVITGVFHVYHFVIVLVAFGLGTTWFQHTHPKSE